MLKYIFYKTILFHSYFIENKILGEDKKMEINILYEDTDILVCEKPAGIASQGTRTLQMDLSDLLKIHIQKKEGIKNPYLGIVHRLDQPVGGVMVYAKTQQAAKELSRQVSMQQMKKKYYAVLTQKPEEESGVLVHYLWKDGKKNMSFVMEEGEKSRAEVKRAELSYQIVQEVKKEEAKLWLVQIDLKTGRHHQIRAQFSHLRCPLWGDSKYNPQIDRKEQIDLGLFAYYLEFRHPKTKKICYYEIKPRKGIFSYFFQ